MDAFERDLRIVYHDTTMALELSRLDPCTLCFVHVGTANGFRVLRVSRPEARLVRSFVEDDRSTRAFDDPDLLEADTAGVVSRLVRGGVLEWV